MIPGYRWFTKSRHMVSRSIDFRQTFDGKNYRSVILSPQPNNQKALQISCKAFFIASNLMIWYKARSISFDEAIFEAKR